MKTKSILMAVVLAVPSLTLLAQDGPADHGGPGGPGGGRGPRRGGSPIVAAIDINKDGEIDASELANASAALRTLDKNGDGKLTQDELRPARPGGTPPQDAKKDGLAGPAGGPQGGPGRNRPVPPIMAALDANQDGELDATEIANAPMALKALDKNGDGKLTQDEMRPPHPEGAPDSGAPQPGIRKQRPQQ